MHAWTKIYCEITWINQKKDIIKLNLIPQKSIYSILFYSRLMGKGFKALNGALTSVGTFHTKGPNLTA